MLSKTQRQTPTVIRRHFKISRIRAFYMRKVKHCQTRMNERLTQIITEFPKLDTIHPFYADLFNVLYDKDHYKVALGQINIARGLIDNIAKDYVRMLKFGDSLFRCKRLKIAALGRMVKVIKRQKPNLQYLEEVRQHMGRLPIIDPLSRAIIICGYPNVGKSSFMTKVTRADVDVQSYSFTTRALYVGHMDYKYLRWQVIDTPGVLDRPLEERNLIEMQAITALAHLRAAILYFIDITEMCGYSIKEQISLLDNIKPLFTNKPLFVVCNKIDLVKPEDLNPEAKELLKGIEDRGIPILYMSTISGQGVMEVKEAACERLLAHRVEGKVSGRKVDSILNRLHLAEPAKRDSKERPAFVPMVTERTEPKKTARERINEMIMKRVEEEESDTYHYRTIDLTEHYDINPEYRTDIIPEIWDWHNIADYIDPEMFQKLEALEREERLREEAGYYAVPKIERDEMREEIRKLAEQIRERKAIMRQEAQLNNNRSHPRPTPVQARGRSLERFKGEMKRIGVEVDSVSADESKANKRSRSRSLSAAPAKKVRFESEVRSRSRSRSKPARDEAGVDDPELKLKLKKIAKKALKKKVGKMGLKGEADRFIGTKNPRHLLAGKRGIGKTERRIIIV